MKKIIYFAGIAAFLILPPFLPKALSHSATGETSRAQIGEEFAVIAIDPQQGFRLGEAAKKRIKLKTQVLSQAASQRIPLEALVEVKGATEVFRVRDAWVSRIPVTVLERKGKGVTIQGSDLKEGDEIVIGGAPLLRVTELDLSAGQKDEHHEEDTQGAPKDHPKHEAAEEYYKYPQLKPVHGPEEKDPHEHPEPKGHSHGNGEVHHHD